MGAYVALQLALRYPPLVTHLVPVAATGGVDMAKYGAVDWREEYATAYPQAQLHEGAFAQHAPCDPRYGGEGMKAVIIGEASGASVEAIMEEYPRHKAVVDTFKARGELIGCLSPKTIRHRLSTWNLDF